MVSAPPAAFASRIAWRSEPTPESLVFVTVKVAMPLPLGLPRHSPRFPFIWIPLFYQACIARRNSKGPAVACGASLFLRWRRAYAAPPLSRRSA